MKTFAILIVLATAMPAFAAEGGNPFHSQAKPWSSSSLSFGSLFDDKALEQQAKSVTIAGEDPSNFSRCELHGNWTWGWSASYYVKCGDKIEKNVNKKVWRTALAMRGFSQVYLSIPFNRPTENLEIAKGAEQTLYLEIFER